MKKTLSALLLMIGISTANIVDTNKKIDYLNDKLDTMYFYEYDNYKINGITVEVTNLDYTHKLYCTDSSIMYKKYTSVDTTTIERLFKNDKDLDKKTLKTYWKIMKDLDLNDTHVKWVFSDFKWIGFDVNGVLYSWDEIDLPSATIPYKQPQINDVFKEQNEYSVIAINGRVIAEGTNIESLSELNGKGFPTGVYIVRIVSNNYNMVNRIFIQ